jgi:hypothetical protein
MMTRESILRGSRYSVYQWNTSENFLLPHVIPQGLRVDAHLTDSPEEVVGKLASDTESFVFHLDVSLAGRFPLQRRLLIHLLSSRGIKVLNGDVIDIRKRTIQQVCRDLGLNSVSIDRRETPEQMVIVKTNLNYGGQREDALSDREKKELGIPLGKPVIKDPLDYRIMRLSEVDESWWSDERIVIEKYVANSEDKIFRFYVMRHAVVLTEAVNPNLIKKMEPGLQRQEHFLNLHEGRFSRHTAVTRRLEKMLADVGIFIRQFRLDFGTLEVVMSEDGEPYIIDVTTTPYWGKESRTDIIDFLRTGITDSQ